MKKILLIVLGVLVAVGLVVFMIVRQQAGYTKVVTASVVREDLTTMVSGTGQIRPKTYVNVGATSFGRITHFYVKEGDYLPKAGSFFSILGILFICTKVRVRRKDDSDKK